VAENVVAAGYDAVAHNRSPEPVEALADRRRLARDGRGHRPAGHRRRRVGVVRRRRPPRRLGDGQVWIDMSTIEPGTTERFAADVADAGAEMLDAPVSGGEESAVGGRSRSRSTVTPWSSTRSARA
jgi:2-hydroxy-3-oxopropionate reductase